MSEPVVLQKLVSKRAAKHLIDFRRDVERSFSGRVRDVVLFGSRARGEAKHSSDYDVAVVLDGSDGRQADRALSDLAYPHIVAGVHIRPVSVSASSMDKPNLPALSQHIKRDGVVIPR